MTITIKESGPLLATLLAALPDSNRTHVKKMLAQGQIAINGAAVTRFDTPLKPGDSLGIGRTPGDAPPAARPRGGAPVQTSKPAPFRVHYEDFSLVAIEKPTGINTNSSDGSESVYKKLRTWYAEQSKGKQGLWMVHRLDKEVSGILLFAKSEAARAHLMDNWKEGTKIYQALCEGRPEPADGTVAGWLVENKAQKMYASPTEVEGARWAITHYRSVAASGGHSRVEVTLETGRKNQIRAHLAGLGCPIVGDRKYGSRAQDHRVMLHAARLTVIHPDTGKPLSITSEPPRGF